MSSSSELLKYLPDIYQNQEFINSAFGDDKNNFLAKYLSAFEKVLLGKDDEISLKGVKVKGLEEKITKIFTYFEPQNTPEEFLSWLASWSALSLRADLPPEQERKFIANIISHYSKRGTKNNLLELLKIFVLGEPKIEEFLSSKEFILGNVRVGQNTYIGESYKPHYFEVEIVLPNTLEQDSNKMNRQIAIARFVIELEKPAHTHYKLIPIYPGTFTIGKSQLGIDSFLGTIPKSEQSIK